MKRFLQKVITAVVVGVLCQKLYNKGYADAKQKEES